MGNVGDLHVSLAMKAAMMCLHEVSLAKLVGLIFICGIGENERRRQVKLVSGILG
jgi:hypothetical protein